MTEICKYLKKLDKNKLSESVVEYILTLDSKAFKTLNVNRIARKFKVNRSYLSRKFKKDKKLALNNYIVTVKILRATILLGTRDELSTEDVAKALGYSNTQYFCRLFKKKIGTTPGKFKAYIKKNKSPAWPELA
jgi:YesN/AraC family two-component response regulator